MVYGLSENLIVISRIRSTLLSMLLCLLWMICVEEEWQRLFSSSRGSLDLTLIESEESHHLLL